MEAHIKAIADQYIKDITSTEQYISYDSEANMMERFPELKDKLNDYRSENFKIQNAYSGEELFDKMEDLQNRYEDILNDGRVSSFLHAETRFIKMMQEVNDYIVRGLDIR